MMNFDFLIRFGVHKDRETLRNLRESISGIIVPAHILCHSTDATVVAISYIKKEYYIDPMTFLYTTNIDKYLGENKKKFKPSIEKLTKDYGLLSLFESNKYNPLRLSDFTESMISDFSQKNINLQCKKVDDKKQNAYSKYTELLKKVGENHIAEELETLHEPKAIIPPYFFFDSNNSDWLKINLRIAQKTKSLTDKKIIPIVATNINCLNNSLLDSYDDFKELFIWLNDFDERDVDLTSLKEFVNFISLAKSRGFVIRNLYGTYFSIILSKFGLSGVCSGIFYGESKGVNAKIGGIPIARYYIRKFHQFFSIPEAISLIKMHKDLLDINCPESMQIIDSNPDNIFSFEKDHSKAQSHFIYSRKREIEDISNISTENLSKELKAVYDEYESEFKNNIISKKSIEYLKRWYMAIGLEEK